MKFPWTVCLMAISALFTSAHAAEPKLIYATNGSGVFGYKDTPRLPWCGYLVHDPDRPAPVRVNPAPSPAPTPAPADAIILFDGKDVSAWRSNSWRAVDGVWETAGSSAPRTKEKFGSFQLHLEWQSPAKVLQVFS